jgi:predicted acetyltransferase
MSVELGPIAPEETQALLAAIAGAFLHDFDEDEAKLDAKVVEPERTLVAREDGRMVATAAVFTRELTVPGGPVRVAAVSLVGVAPGHRRRGLLSAMMRRQLADVREAGEAVAALWASEASIYGRFGYGIGTRVAELDVRTRDARLRPDVERLDVAPELMLAQDARGRIAPIHEAVRARRPGMLARSDSWWDLILHDPEREREGAGRLRAVVLGDQGYALYAFKEAWGAGGTEGEVRLRELVATTPAAAAALWGFLLELDLVRRVKWEIAPADEPLIHMVDNARAVTVTVGDGMWVRLVDLPRALRERTYSAPFDVVLDVADEVCPENAGRHRLAWDGERATCEPTRAKAGLELSGAELGAAFLGGTTLDSLARADRVRERTPGALRAASVAFRGAAEPWCPETF